MHTTNYVNAFIEVAEDCPVTKGEIPPEKNGDKTIARIQYEMISENPYKYTSDDVIFNCFVVKNNIAMNAYDEQRNLFFSKGQPCLRSSPLPKRDGWGIHSDGEGRVALYPVESPDYEKYRLDESLSHKKAMRTSKK